MFANLRFYWSHSWNDLLVNRRRSAFALLSIGAGVAAIVSLQLLAGMIGDSLVGSLQERNRGDIQVTLKDYLSFRMTQVTQDSFLDEYEAAEETGHFTTIEPIPGVGLNYISESGLRALLTWAEEEFPGQLEFSYGYALSDEFSIFLNSGAGVAMTAIGSGTYAANLTPTLVDASNFPLYGSVKTLDGREVSDLLLAPTDIVIDRQVAEALNLQVGESVRLSGSSADFIVRGIVPTEAEVQGLDDILTAVSGFYYLDNAALELFDDALPILNAIHIRLADPQTLDLVSDALLANFLAFSTTTTADIARQNQSAAGLLNDLVTVMGMISLLIGCIAVINTMQVVVQRRMQEIAVLKTLGLQGSQVNWLLFTEAVLMGMLGSAFGLFLGILFTVAIQQVAEGIVAQSLTLRIRFAPLLNGFVVGTLVSAVFGLLPTLNSALIRPAAILRPNEMVLPRAGVLRMLLVLLLVILALAVIINTFIRNPGLAVGVSVGTFFIAGMIYMLLNIFIWIFGRFIPSFGFVDFKIAKRQILSARARSATTLLALVVGVFSLAVITLFAQTIANLLDVALAGQAGNLSIYLQDEGSIPELKVILAEAPGVSAQQISLQFEAELIALEEDGQSLGPAEIKARIRANLEESDVENILTGFTPDPDERARYVLETLNLLAERDAAQLDSLQLTAGRGLLETDRNLNQPGILMYSSDAVSAAGIDVGERLTYRRGDVDGGAEFTVTVVGVIESDANLGNLGEADPIGLLLRDTLPWPSSVVRADVDVAEEHIGALRARISQLPGASSLDSAVFSRVLQRFLDTFVAFPQLVAALGLIVGGFVIANSVTLATIERRREIAVMKAIGLPRERVMFMLLLENGLLGLLGGLVGVGIGLLILVSLPIRLSETSMTTGLPNDAIPYWTAFGLMALCVLVALVAASATAWRAAGEKPLHVLRYE